MFANALAGFNTFAGSEEFWRWYIVRRDRSRTCEAWIERHDEVLGYCDCCNAVVPLRVATGAMFEAHPSLREGLICPRGLSGRSRLVLRVLKCLSGGSAGQIVNLILFEDFTPLRRALSTLPDVRSYPSSFDKIETKSGTAILVNGGETTHQDITASSYADATADIVVHCDVLEHIPDYRAALKDNLRVLKQGGILLFTAPFFVQQQKNRSIGSRRRCREGGSSDS
jgi:hypothetical protein